MRRHPGDRYHWRLRLTGRGPTLAPMRILVNGVRNEVEEGETLERLLARLGMDPGRVAVERNLEIVPKSRYGETHLAEGDRVEIVHFVGGGG